MNFRKIALVVSSAILLSVSLLVPQINFIIWFAFVPLLVLLPEINWIESLGYGFFCGISFFASLLYWINQYETRILVIVLTLAAPFAAAFAFLTRWLWKRYHQLLIRIAIVPVIWLLIHFVYSFTPVDIIGNQIAFLEAPHFPGILRTVGLSGMTFLVLLTNSLITHYFMNRKNISTIGLCLVGFLLIFGATSKFHFYQTQPLKIAIVQHNFPIDPQWRLQNKTKIMETYEQTIQNLGSNADLIVFGQYGLPIDALREPEIFNRLANRYHTSIILGTYVPKTAGGSVESGARTDSALLFSPNKQVQEYQAVTPPPFRKIGQVLGSLQRALMIGKIKAGILLCYEDVRSEEGRLRVLNNAQVLIALSNPGHFLNTNLPYYHFTHDRIRAIETGKYVIRASPNGFSALINPNGELIKVSRLNEETILTGVIFPNDDQTRFVQVGDFIPNVCALVGMILLVIAYARNSINFLARKIR